MGYGSGGGDDDDDDDDDDDGGGGGSNCGGTVPLWATGVRVEVRENHPTFFIRVLPGVPDDLTLRARATAHVQRLARYPADAPFILCGDNAWVHANPSGGGADTNVNILNGDNTIKSSYVGWTFRVHDNKLNNPTDPGEKAGCDTKASSWNGWADGPQNKGKTAPGWFAYDTGTKSGPARTVVDRVNGAQGCAPGGTNDDCVMILPIARRDPKPTEDELWVVGFAAFRVTRNDANSHNAKLLDDYISTGPGSDNWCRDCGASVVVVRLTD